MLDTILNTDTYDHIAVYNNNLLVFLTENNLDSIAQSCIQQWDLPQNSPAPYADSTPALVDAGSFDTSIWHGGYPDTNKAFLKIILWVENIDAQHSIVINYGLDGVASTTTALTTINNADVSGTGAQVVTAYFPTTGSTGRSIQLRFALTSDDTVSSLLYAFAVVAQLRPTKLRAWEIWARLEDEPTRESLYDGPGYDDPTRKPALLTNLNSLEDTIYPIMLREDFDGDGVITATRVVIMPGERVMEYDGDGNEVHRLVLQEADVS